MKKIFFLSLAVLLAVFAIVNNGQSKTKTYYSGDAVSFNNQIYVGSANTNSLEVLKLENNELKQLAKIRPFDSRFGRYGNFYDMKFSLENGRLFVYAISGFSLYKYELSGDELKLVNYQKNTYWEWYTRVDKFGDNVVTISDKGVKIWNNDFKVINAYAVTNKENPHNVCGHNNRFILNVQNNYLTVFDRENRVQLANIPLNYKNNPDNRQAYQDENGQLYAIDDYYAKKFDLNGHLLGSFKHLDYAGYDAAASGYSNYIYFSNGIGVIKLDKNTMQSVVSSETVNLGGPRGWAMGLKVVYANGDKIVVFNNANILVLDDKLNKLAVYEADEEAEETSLENLYLNLNHNFGAPTATVVLNGGGYLPNEKLVISFGGVKIVGQADNRGRFTKTLSVPSLPASRVDIKTDGATSGLSYSIAFQIIQ